MDRRNYRGNMGTGCGSMRNNSSYKPCEPVCGDIAGGYGPEDMCGRDDFDNNMERFPIGMCYVPWQKFRNLYENEFIAMAHGTIFKELDLDFYGRSCK